MKHFLFICLAVLALGNRSIALEGRPNILLIQTDDQGYDDIGIHHPPGENLLETPHIDRLAQQSLQFENYYMSTVCAPSRAMLLTGRHHYKAGVWWVHGGTDWVNLDETLLAEPLKAAGYRTAHFGKWHSGKGDGYWPWDRGFDEGTYVDLYFYRDNRMLRNSKPLQTHGWTEKALADLAIDYLKDAATRDKPFFIYYNPITAHTGKLSTQHAQEPREDLFAPEEYVSKYEAKGLSGMFARLYGALDFLDTQLGRIFQTLEETGQMDNTIILYMSDNGSLRLSGRGETYYTDEEWSIRVPSGMKGGKGFVDENGIRSYLLVRVPGVQPAVLSEPCAAYDIFPTLLDLAGVEMPQDTLPLDGVSLRPLIENGAWSHSDRYIHLHEVAKDGLFVDQVPALDENRRIVRPQPLLAYENPSKWITVPDHGSVRQGHWKWSKGMLYDMRTPEGRRETAQADAPEIKQRLAEEYERWWTDEVQMAPGSFQRPLQFIGWPGRNPSTLYPFCAIERTAGRVKIRPHEVTGFSEAGDELILPVEVKQAGTYQTTFIFEPGPAANGAELETAFGTAGAVSASIQEKGRLVFPPKALSVGPAELRIRLIAPGGKGDVFKKLKRIVLTRSGENQ